MGSQRSDYDRGFDDGYHGAFSDCFCELRSMSENRYTADERAVVLDIVARLYEKFGCHLGDSKIRTWVDEVMDGKHDDQVRPE